MEVDRGARRPRIETPAAEPPTQGPTMALRPGLSTSGVRVSSEVKSQTLRSRGAVSQAAQTLPSSPTSPSSTSTADAPSSKRDRLWVYGGLIVLVAITGYGAWMLTRSQGTTAPRDRPPPLAAPATMSLPTPPPAASAVAPAPPPAPAASAVAPAPPPAPAASAVAPPPPPAPPASPATATSPVTVPPSAALTPAAI